MAQMVGPGVFDFNETHIYNDSWPPHAKLHNAQTMSSGVALSVATLVNLWRPGAERVGVDAAALSASVYWVSRLSAFFYPGTASVDPPGKDNWVQLRFRGELGKPAGDATTWSGRAARPGPSNKPRAQPGPGGTGFVGPFRSPWVGVAVITAELTLLSNRIVP